MDRTERYYKIDRLLRERRAVSCRTFLETLEISRATFGRDIEYLRDRFNAPIVYDRCLRGYRYDTAPGEEPFALPGLWFNAAELHALLTAQQLLARVQPGLLEPRIKPLQQRIQRLLEQGDHSWEELGKRVRILQLADRPVASEHFETIASAVLSRRRLAIDYYIRTRDERISREVSPQRLVHYRDNWYLDAWCHLRNGLRSFALDAIVVAKPLERKAKDTAESTLDKELGSGYGIFAGSNTATARLRFTPKRARWVAREQWHPDQQGHFDEHGHYLLEIPYSDDRELIMDILKYGPDVEVIAPDSLRRAVAAKLRGAAQQYGGPDRSGL